MITLTLTCIFIQSLLIYAYGIRFVDVAQPTRKQNKGVRYA